MKNNALITGITGFTGPYVKKALESLGYIVYGTSLNSSDSPYIIRTDLRNPSDVKQTIERVKPKTVIHLAGLISHNTQEIDKLFSINSIGTFNLLHALDSLKEPPRSIILSSTAHIYAPVHTGQLAENAELDPKNHYAHSKFVAENIAGIWQRRLPITVVRPFNYTGVGHSENYLIPKIVNHFAHRKKTIILGNLDISRDYSDVRSVSEIYARITMKQLSGETFNICSGKSYSPLQVIRMMNQISGHNIEVRSDRQHTRPNDIKVLEGSPKKLWRSIGEIATTPFEDTLAWMYQHQLSIQ